MSLPETASAIPRRRIPWLKLLLVVSLAGNLLFIGGGIARYYTYGPPERMKQTSQMQFFPHRFFGELDRSRRLELLQVFKDYGPVFDDGRKAARAEVVNLAAALEADPYDPAKVKAAVDAFTAASGDLVAAGGQAALTLIASLTPDERNLLAHHIRMREDANRHKGDAPPDAPPAD